MSDAVAAVTHARQAALAQQISTAVAKKQLDATEAQGEAVNQLLKSAAALSKSLATGGTFDAVA